MSDNRPAKSILIWRGSAWLKKQEQKFGKGRQGHRRHLHVRRWESWVARWSPNIEASEKAEISHEWMSIAQDRTEWCRHVEKHAEWTNNTAYTEKNTLDSESIDSLIQHWCVATEDESILAAVDLH